MTKIRFDQIMANNSTNGFLVMTSIFNNPVDATLLGSKTQDPEGKTSTNTEKTMMFNQGNKQPKSLQQTASTSMSSMKILATQVKKDAGDSERSTLQCK